MFVNCNLVDTRWQKILTRFFLRKASAVEEETKWAAWFISLM